MCVIVYTLSLFTAHTHTIIRNNSVTEREREMAMIEKKTGAWIAVFLSEIDDIMEWI